MQKSGLDNVGVYCIDEMCCGCTACYNVCPVNAIEMIQNEKGFFVPKINEKCINCGLCKMVCQIERGNDGMEPIHKYGVINKNLDCRMSSSSGGVYSAIIWYLSKEYGNKFHCFGAAWDENLQVKHVEAKTKEECDRFKGSKYVQSDLSNVYKQIEVFLKKGDFVLFTGTGCQCAGLKRYIEVRGIDDSNLFIIDLVCHGVPSGKIWKDYIAVLEDRGKKIISYSFRNKKEGWRGLHPEAICEDGTLVQMDKIFMSYGRMFGNLSLNNVCYSCKYATKKRVGDITLGDFWGVEKTICSFDDGKGVSLCLINSEKGLMCFEQVSSYCEVYEINDDSYLQPQLKHPTPKNILYNDFWKDYNQKGYMFIANKYTGHGKIYRGIMKVLKKIKIVLSKKS